MELEDILAAVGLSDKEVKIYKTLLALGPATVSKIAKYAGVNRSTAYVLLESLKARTLIESTDKEIVKKFYPLSPKNVVRDLEAAASSAERTAKAAKKILSELKIEMPTHSGSAPKIRFFSGAEEIKRLFASTVDSLEMIRASAKADVQIMGDTVVVFSPHKKSGIVIESAEIAQSLRRAFGA